MCNQILNFKIVYENVHKSIFYYKDKLKIIGRLIVFSPLSRQSSDTTGPSRGSRRLLNAFPADFGFQRHDIVLIGLYIIGMAYASKIITLKSHDVDKQEFGSRTWNAHHYCTRKESSQKPNDVLC